MDKPKEFPKQTQSQQPGTESEMNPKPEIIRDNYKGSEKLKGKIALITGGDSGIGRSTAVHFAREGANVAIVYYDELEDAKETKRLIRKEGAECLLLRGDLRNEDFCKKVVAQTIAEFGTINILVNNAAMQFPEEDIENISTSQIHQTFETNVYPLFFVTQEVLKSMQQGDCIINTTSVTAYRGSEHLLDYSSSKGAIVSFTRSAATMLAEKGIRVNAVAPGPVWTPLIPATFTEEQVAVFGQDTPMKRAAQPSEIGPAYVFLASEDSSYITGQVIHPNGGEIVGG